MLNERLQPCRVITSQSQKYIRRVVSVRPKTARITDPSMKITSILQNSKPVVNAMIDRPISQSSLFHNEWPRGLIFTQRTNETDFGFENKTKSFEKISGMLKLEKKEPSTTIAIKSYSISNLEEITNTRKIFKSKKIESRGTEEKLNRCGKGEKKAGKILTKEFKDLIIDQRKKEINGERRKILRSLNDIEGKEKVLKKSGLLDRQSRQRLELFIVSLSKPFIHQNT
jgi:hypothetical protein